ncbi:MAG TPA: MFS transporter [Acidimicrobiia bacterium]|nr:MFS transporter [Acidimicrobiia bacterium]
MDGRPGNENGYARGYTRVLGANAISNLGDGMLLAAAPLLALELTDDAFLVAGVSVAATLPWLLVGLLSGVVVDRMDRRLLRALVDSLRALALAVFALAVALDVVELWMLFAVVFVVGIGETIADTAAHAMLPMVVAPERLRVANSQIQASTLISDRLVGPPLGGVAFVAAASLPFWIDAASFAIAGALVLSLRGRFRAVAPDVDIAPTPDRGRADGLRRELTAGLTALFADPILGAMARVVAVWNALDAMMTAVLVVLAGERLGIEGGGYGVLLGALAVGGLIGSATAPAMLRWLGDGGALLFVIGASVVTAVTLALTTTPWVAGAALALAGWLGVTWNITGAALRQELVPPQLLGRVTSAYLLFALGALPVGAVLGGLAARVDIRLPYAIAAVGSLAIYVWALPRLSNRQVARARRRATPERYGF